MKKLFEKTKLLALSAIPTSVSPGNQYAKSLGALMCLGVSADLLFEVEEFQQASAFIEKDAILRQEGLTTRAVEYFKGYSNTIREVMHSDNLDFPSIQTKMISEVRECPDEFVDELRAVITMLRTVAGPLETAIFNRIDL